MNFDPIFPRFLPREKATLVQFVFVTVLDNNEHVAYSADNSKETRKEEIIFYFRPMIHAVYTWTVA